MLEDYMRLYEKCELCPRRCGADRRAGQTGVCGETADVRAARAALHFWEEPCISGREGSGAVFFTGCTLGCIFCQNHAISGGAAGRKISPDRLADIFLELQGKGANNINLVTPDHFAPTVVMALHSAKAQGLRLPVICNCGGYMAVQTVKLLAPVVDVWLPDFKYRDDSLGRCFSHVPDYFERAGEALAIMHESAGAPCFDERGMITRGIIVRHLVLPGHTRDSIGVLRYLHETFGNDIYISIMNQYTPMPGISGAGYPELARRVTRREYEKVADAALEMGIEKGFLQEGKTAEESFIPPFDCEGI